MITHIKSYFRTYLNFAKMLLAQEPTYLVFYVTNSCNSRCITCFNWQQNNSPAAEAELSLGEIEHIARKAGQLYYVTLGGGEPFLRGDLDEVCHLFYQFSHSRIFSIPTNCLTPATIAARVEAMLVNCPEAIFRISMSIDGIGELHDRIRGVPGNFAKVHETYDLLAALRLKYPRLEILANTTFCAENQERMAEIHEYVSSHFLLDMYGLTLIRGEVESPVVKNIDMDNYAAAMDIFDDIRRSPRGVRRHPLQRLMATLPYFTRREVMKTHAAVRRTYACHAIKRLLVMDAYGNLFPCEMLKVSLGQLRNHDYDLHTVLRKKENKVMLASIKAGECNCTWECAIQNSLVFDVVKYPAMFYRAFFK